MKHVSDTASLSCIFRPHSFLFYFFFSFTLSLPPSSHSFCCICFSSSLLFSFFFSFLLSPFVSPSFSFLFLHLLNANLSSRFPPRCWDERKQRGVSHSSMRRMNLVVLKGLRSVGSGNGRTVSPEIVVHWQENGYLVETECAIVTTEWAIE